MYENDFYNEEFEAFLEYVRNLPRANVKLLDERKYMTMLSVAMRLKELLCKTMEEGEINVEVDQEFGMGSVSVELSVLIVEEPKLFCEIVSEANNFEVYPLTNGNIKLNVTFHNVLRAIG